MVYLLAFLLVGLAWYTRNRHVELLVLETKYKLFALRDNLRQRAIDGEVDANDWLFDYLDESISRCVERLPELNIYFCMVLYFAHRKDAKYRNFRLRVAADLYGKPGFTEIYDLMGRTILEFMESRHKALFNTVKFSFFSLIGPVLMYRIIRDTFQASTAEVRLYPETSAAEACLT